MDKTTDMVFIAVESPYHDNDTILGVFADLESAVACAEKRFGNPDCAELVSVERWVVGTTEAAQEWRKYRVEPKLAASMAWIDSTEM